MRGLIAFLSFVAAQSAFAIVSPCGIPQFSAEDVWTIPGELVMFSASSPVGLCGWGLSTPTPAVIAVESVGIVGGDTIRVSVRALAPGDGILIVSGSLPGGSGYHNQVAVIHVDSCAEGAHSVGLLPVYSAPLQTKVTITPEIHGSFTRSLSWSVNGRYYSTGPVFVFTPPAGGAYTIAFHAESLCASIAAETTLLVGAQRSRAVRRR
jgi:hypothetical protein